MTRAPACVASAVRSAPKPNANNGHGLARSNRAAAQDIHGAAKGLAGNGTPLSQPAVAPPHQPGPCHRWHKRARTAQPRAGRERGHGRRTRARQSCPSLHARAPRAPVDRQTTAGPPIQAGSRHTPHPSRRMRISCGPGSGNASETTCKTLGTSENRCLHRSRGHEARSTSAMASA